MNCLFFVSKAPQFFNTFFKEFGTIILIAVLPKIRIIFIPAMILFPCCVNAEASEPREIDSVFMNSSFMFEEFPLKFFSIPRDQASIQGIKEMIFPEVFYPGNVYGVSEFGGFLNQEITPGSSGGKSMVQPLTYPMTDNGDYSSSSDSIEPFLTIAEINNPLDHPPGSSPLFWPICFFTSSFGSTISSACNGGRD